MKANFYHEINSDPEPEDVGKIIVTTTIFREDDNLTFSTSTLAQEFILNDYECESKEALNSFLVETGINDDVIYDALMKLFCYVEHVTLTIDDYLLYTPDSLLDVKMDLELDPRDYNDYDFDDDDDGENEIEEAFQQLSFDEINDNIESRPASQFAVNSLPRNVYEDIEFNSETCSVCQEEFGDGQIVVSLPCGHDFHEECIVRWFETSHACPLCRFQLPFED